MAQAFAILLADLVFVWVLHVWSEWYWHGRRGLNLILWSIGSLKDAETNRMPSRRNLHG